MSIKRWHEPIAGHGATGYAALCTVVQAFPLAVLFWVIGSDSRPSILAEVAAALHDGSIEALPWTSIAKIMIAVPVFIIVWHRYILDIQFIAWRITWRDTLIPFTFSALESALALLVLAPTIYFVACVTAIVFLGIPSYAQTLPQHKKDEARRLFREHFDKHGDDVHDAVSAFWRNKLMLMFQSSALALGAMLVALFLHLRGMDSDAIETLAIGVAMAVIVARLFRDDITWRLEAIYKDELVATPREASFETPERRNEADRRPGGTKDTSTRDKEETIKSFYYTNMSIIMGVMLALLFSQLYSWAAANRPITVGDGWTTVLSASIVFSIVLATYFEYYYFVLTIRSTNHIHELAVASGPGGGPSARHAVPSARGDCGKSGVLLAH